MKEQGQVSRRQVLSLGGMIAVGSTLTGVLSRDAAALRKIPRRPCLGEPGYQERVAKLLQGEDLPANPST